MNHFPNSTTFKAAYKAVVILILFVVKRRDKVNCDKIKKINYIITPNPFSFNAIVIIELPQAKLHIWKTIN